MRPEQKIIMSSRQTGERAERLLEWLDQSRMMLKSQSRALRIEVQGIANELLTLIEAVEQPPTAGLMGAWGSARAELIGALIGDAAQSPAPPVNDDSRLVLGRERLLALFPRDSDGGASASLRCVAAARTEAPYRFPVRLSLLGQLDLVKIIAAAYLVHVPARRQRLASPDVIAQRLTTKAQEIVQQAFSGISRRDIDTLRDTLHAVAPENVGLRRLDACGYWDTLGGLIPHLPEMLRRKAFALLWGEDPALTALFERLSEAIELMGFSGEAFVGLDALMGRDPATGWMIRHEDSIIATNTILTCHKQPERTVRVSSRHGRAADVERFVLAALVDECWLPLAPQSLPLLETADLLALPAPRPVMLWPSPRLALGPDGGQNPLQHIEALEIFAAQKASYLIDRAIRRQTLTSLVVAADIVDRGNATEIDAGSTAQIANWVEGTQGETPHARERRRTGLCILAAEVAGTGAAIEPVLTSADGTDPRLAATIEAVLDGNADWAQEWTPNRPFRNVFTWRPPRTAMLPSSIVGQPGSADILRFDRLKGSDAGPAVAPIADLAASQDLANLLHAVTQATSSTVHLQQLSARLADLRRSLSARFLRLHLSNDPSMVVEWRRQICHVARNRLQRAAATGNFGRLQHTLMFSEGEALAVLARLKVEDPRYTGQVVPDLRTLEPARIVEACLEAWVAAMRQVARAPVLMRAIQVPGSVVAHIVDELVLGALRIGLQEKLSEAVRRIQLSAIRAVDCEQSVAALMERGINAYVEALDPGARALRSSVHRDTRFGMGVGSVTTGMASARAEMGAATARRPAVPASSSIADDWAETFADLIEANILGAPLLGGTGQLNRELGEVLNAMSASPFEGFQ